MKINNRGGSKNSYSTGRVILTAAERQGQGLISNQLSISCGKFFASEFKMTSNIGGHWSHWNGERDAACRRLAETRGVKWKTACYIKVWMDQFSLNTKKRCLFLVLHNPNYLRRQIQIRVSIKLVFRIFLYTCLHTNTHTHVLRYQF